MKILRQPHEWEQGVRGLPVADLQDGVLFVMPEERDWPVTMRGVDIPLDVYWLSPSGMVRHHASLMPGQLIYYKARLFSQYILELPMEDEPRYRVGDFLEVPP